MFVNITYFRSLADVDGDMHLDKAEFVIAKLLLYGRSQGKGIPSKLPALLQKPGQFKWVLTREQREDFEKKKALGLILSGGPSSVFDANAPSLSFRNSDAAAHNAARWAFVTGSCSRLRVGGGVGVDSGKDIVFRAGGRIELVRLLATGAKLQKQ